MQHIFYYKDIILNSATQALPMELFRNNPVRFTRWSVPVPNTILFNGVTVGYIW
jgi:hypothetical protein